MIEADFPHNKSNKEALLLGSVFFINRVGEYT